MTKDQIKFLRKKNRLPFDGDFIWNITFTNILWSFLTSDNETAAAELLIVSLFEDAYFKYNETAVMKTTQCLER